MITLTISGRYRWIKAITVFFAWTVLSWSQAVAQTSDDWQQWSNLAAECDRLEKAGRIDESARVAEQVQSLVQRRFPPRLQFLGLGLIQHSRAVQARFEESLRLSLQLVEQCEQFTPQTSREKSLHDLCYGAGLKEASATLGHLGRPKEAIPLCEKAVKWLLQQNQPLQAAEHQNNLGLLYTHLGEYGKAIEQFRETANLGESLATRESPPGQATHVLATALNGWGDVHNITGRHDLADPILRRALKLSVAASGWRNTTTTNILRCLGIVCVSQRRWKEAESYCRYALEGSEANLGPNHPDTLKTVTLLAGVVRNQGRLAEAEALLRTTVARWESLLGREHPQTAYEILALAVALFLQGKDDEAERLLREALAIQEKKLGPTHHDMAETLQHLAAVRRQQGDLSESLQLLNRLAEIHQQNPLRPAEAAFLHKERARVLWQSGKKQEALAELETALKQADIQLAYSAGIERERATAFEGFSAQFERLIHWRAELGDVEKLFLAIERMKARSLLDELRLKNVDLLAGVSEAERRRLAERESDLRRRLSEAERQADALPNLGPNPASEVVAQRKQAVANIFRAREDLYQHLADIRSASPAYRELLSDKSQPVTLDAARQMVGEDELMLAYSIGQEHSHVMVIRNRAAYFLPLVLDEKTAAELDISPGPLTAPALATLLTEKDHGVLPALSSSNAASEGLNRKLAALWQVLVPESERAALTNGKVKLLTILPDGPLAMLPFETLIVANDSEPEYLLDVGPPIAYAPSAAVLLNLARREKADAAVPQQLLTLGDPAYPRAGAPGQDAVDRQLGITRAADQFRAGLTRLPYTGWESTWVQQAFEKVGFKSVKLIGAEATEAAIRRHAPGHQVVHLACHGMADQSYGNFFGSLAIAPGKAGDSRDDGFLSMSEIYELDLTGCELAILSACETNYGPQQQGEGVWALSRGFLVAGSRRVIASNWVVDDQAGATLVSYFASYLTKTGPDASARDYAAALHTAKKNVRKEEKWRHPFYWSSLVLVGPK